MLDRPEVDLDVPGSRWFIQPRQESYDAIWEARVEREDTRLCDVGGDRDTERIRGPEATLGESGFAVGL